MKLAAQRSKTSKDAKQMKTTWCGRLPTWRGERAVRAGHWVWAQRFCMLVALSSCNNGGTIYGASSKQTTTAPELAASDASVVFAPDGGLSSDAGMVVTPPENTRQPPDASVHSDGRGDTCSLETCADAGSLPVVDASADAGLVPAPFCGNGKLEPGEDCEPPSSANCDAQCHPVFTLRNSAFNGSLDGWQSAEAPSSAVTRSSIDADGSAEASGSAEIDVQGSGSSAPDATVLSLGDPNLAGASLGQCVQTAPGGIYQLSAKVLLVTGTPGSASIELGARFYSRGARARLGTASRPCTRWMLTETTGKACRCLHPRLRGSRRSPHRPVRARSWFGCRCRRT